MQIPEFLVQDDDGFIHVRGHRIGLQNLVHYYNEGYSAEMAACEYPTLSLAVIHKVLGFYLENQAEVDEYIGRARQIIKEERQKASGGPDVVELRKRLAARQQAQGA